jgi:hypothetical protein
MADRVGGIAFSLLPRHCRRALHRRRVSRDKDQNCLAPARRGVLRQEGVADAYGALALG